MRGDRRKKSEHPLVRFVGKFPSARILVIGDLMLDHYIWGSVRRISPEAPVPVVNVTSESMLLGGAANVCHNIVALGGKADLCGVIGQDDSGRWIRNRLKEMGISGSGVFEEEGRPTTRKTRIIAHSQQVVRFDHEKKGELSSKCQALLFSWIEAHLGRYRCLVISDYDKGVVTKELLDGAIRRARDLGIQIVVDPKLSHFPYYQGVTVITPNHLEASEGAGFEIENEKTLMKAGWTILEKLNCESVLITRGEQGMSLFEKNGEITHIPAAAKNVYDVTGAGDTVVSVLALALSSGASLKEAAFLANQAAGIVVGIVGTATVTPEMLISDLNRLA